VPTTRAVQEEEEEEEEEENGNLTLNLKTVTGLARLALSSAHRVTGCQTSFLFLFEAAAAQAAVVVALVVAYGKDRAQLVAVVVLRELR